MPIPSFAFAFSRPLDPGRNFRAYADVRITNAAGLVRSPTYQCLVDTGSDYTILPSSAAAAVGIVPTGPLVTIRSVGGAVLAMSSQLGVQLEIEGKPVTVQVVFSAALGFTPILGRIELVTAFDVAFDNVDWHWG